MFKSLNMRKIWKRKELRKDDTIMEDPRETDIVIPVMGPTGAGKSTFVNNVAGHTVTSVGHDLKSHTSKIQHVVLPYPSDATRRVILVDTPGFDDTYVEDSEILRRIAVWLAKSYSDKMKLGGLVYLHEISQRRMFGTSRKNLDMFNKLCGKEALKNVILATTGWGDINAEIGERRESQLAKEHWKHMLDLGSRMHRLDSPRSAREVVNLILADAEKANAVDAVQIQGEMVEDDKMLGETEAGSGLQYTLEEAIEIQKRNAKHQAVYKLKIQEEFKYASASMKEFRKSDIIILVIGTTGTGKSTFINTLAGSSVASVGHNLGSRTSTIEPFIIKYPRDDTRRVVMVDTPGFDGTHAEDSEILRRISVWISRINENELRLTGIVYLHDISQRRMLGMSCNMDMLNKLRSEEAIRNIIFVTATWDNIQGHVRYMHEMELGNEWKRALDLVMCRLGGSSESAWRVVDLLLANSKRGLAHVFGSQSQLVETDRKGPEAHKTLELSLQTDGDVFRAASQELKSMKTRRVWGQRELKKDDQILKDGRGNDDIILVMGPTGVGKTTFINSAVGHPTMYVSHGLRSKMQHTIVPHLTNPHRRVILVEIPSFDNASIEDAEILRRIAVWLAQSYSDKMKLAGIIYLHDISQICMRGTTRKNFNMFKELCGTMAMKGVILATTKWGSINVDAGTRREEELANDLGFWKPVLDLGSRICRFMGSSKSAWEIIDMILAHADSQDALDAVQIQVELVEHGKMLGETDAGRALRYMLEEYPSLHKNLTRQAQKQVTTEQRMSDESERTLPSVPQEIKTPDASLSKRIRSPFSYIRSKLSP